MGDGHSFMTSLGEHLGTEISGDRGGAQASACPGALYTLRTRARLRASLHAEYMPALHRYQRGRWANGRDGGVASTANIGATSTTAGVDIGAVAAAF